MMIERGKTKVLKRQGPQALKGLFDCDLSLTDLLEEPFESFWVHVHPFSGLASRSIKSLTAFRQDFLSYSTALISCMIGISM